MPQPCNEIAQQKPAMVWGSFTLESCVCHKRNKGTCAFWWVCSVRQINSVSRLEKVSALLRRLLNNKSHIPSYSYLSKKRCHSFIKQASFLGLEIPSPNTKPPQNPTPQVLHQGVDCVKQLCEKYLSLAVEEEALALNSFKILVLIGLFFSKRNWSEFPTDGLSGKLAILSLEWNDLKIHLRNIRSKFGEKNSDGKRWGKCGSFPKWSWTVPSLAIGAVLPLVVWAKWRILKSPGQNGEKWPHSTGNVCTCTYVCIYIFIYIYINCIILIVYSLHGAFGIGFKGGKFSDVLLVGFGYRTQNCGPLDFWKDADILHSFWQFVWAQGITQKDDLMVSQEAMDQDVRDSLQNISHVCFPQIECQPYYFQNIIQRYVICTFNVYISFITHEIYILYTPTSKTSHLVLWHKSWNG